MRRRNLLVALLLSVMLYAGFVFAQPKRNISAHKHPNLAAAQRLVAQAYQKVEAAQKANEFDMSGHAAKAKSLLDQASAELKMAAEEANQNK